MGHQVIKNDFIIEPMIKTIKKKDGPDRGLNPEPLAPKARIIPLDHQAAISFSLLLSCFVNDSNYAIVLLFKQIFKKS
jgi:hypothetical protein